MIEIFNEDCIVGLKRLEDESVDVVCTDPPYLYLKHKLDRAFDEDKLFAELKRVLKPKGFIIIFGRGASFYRWGHILSELGLTFKEEVIWDKRRISSPMSPLLRVHETISIWVKGAGSINKVRVPYQEHRKFDIDKVVGDVNRLKSALGNPKSLLQLKAFIENGHIEYSRKRSYRSTSNIQAGFGSNPSVEVNVLKALTEGLRETSIISEDRPHYKSIHPTEKPVGLLKRLLALVETPNMMVIDPFMGSGSCGEACLNKGYRFKGWEIDAEYFESAKDRLIITATNYTPPTHTKPARSSRSRSTRSI